MAATGWSGTEIQTRIMKGLWVDDREPPSFAKFAYAKHWITLAKYLQIPMVPCATLKEFLYKESPFLGLSKKAAS